MNAGKGWMTSASVVSGVPSLIASTSSPDDLARTRSDKSRADQHAALAVANQLERATMKVMDGAACGLGRIGAGDDDVDTSRARGRLRQSHRSDFRIGECHAGDRRVIGPRMEAAQTARNHLPVVVGEVGEPTQPRDVTDTKDAVPYLERHRVDLQPAALGLRDPGPAPCLRVRAPTRGNQEAVGRDPGSYFR